MIRARRLSAPLKILLLSMAVLPALPAEAQAASRYAAPTAQGSSDCSSPMNACSIAMAVSGASSGDDIFVLANLGDYNLAASGISDSGKTLHFHGMSGRPRLLATGNPATLSLAHASSSADNLYLQNSNPTNGEPLSVNPGTGNTATVNNVIANQTGNDHPCYFGGGVTWTNSVCWESSTTAHDLGVETDGTNTMRNDVVWVAGSSAVGIRAFGRAGVPGDDVLINTIVRATGSGDADLAANAQDGSATATFDVGYSNFATTRAEGTAGLDHFNTASSDQSALPMLVNPTGGDFHELAGSPTIDAGVNDPANGSTDFDGDPRIDTVNGKTDIGADEFEAGSSGGGGGGGGPSPMPPSHCDPFTEACSDTSSLLACTDLATLLVTCSNPDGLPGVCGPTGTVFPQCSQPTVLPTVCSASGTALVACQSLGPNVAACGGVGSILPPCASPPLQVPMVCGPPDTGLPPCSAANNTVTVCGPPGTGLPACSFSTMIRAAPIGLGGAPPGGNDNTVNVTLSCPSSDASAARASAARRAAHVARNSSCAVSAELDSLRSQLVSTLRDVAGGASYKLVIRARDLGLDRAVGSANANCFTQRANRLIDAVFLSTQGVPDHIRAGAVLAALGTPLGASVFGAYFPGCYTGPSQSHPNQPLGPDLPSRLDPGLRFGEALINAVNEYTVAATGHQAILDDYHAPGWNPEFFIHQIGGGAAQGSVPRAKPTAPTCGATATHTTIKRVKLRAGTRRRIRFQLSRQAASRLAACATPGARFVPVRIAIAFAAKPRPVTRFLDIRLPIKPKQKHHK